MPKVCIIGSINNDIVVKADRHPKPGETIMGTSLQNFPGGKGANQAVAVAKAGVDSRIIGLVGDDPAGRQLIEFLKKSGVNTHAIDITKDAPTGTAIITVANGENSIVVVAGANGLLNISEISPLVLQTNDVIVAQYETPIETTLAAFKTAKNNSTITILNPAPAADVSDELLMLTDYLIVNEHEFQLIFDTAPDVNSLTETAQKRQFNGSIIVTLGAGGAMALCDKETYRIAGHQIKAVDSTGAGDCFVGYFAAGIADNLGFRESLERANTAAAINVTNLGAASSIPSIGELAKYNNSVS